MGRKGVRVLLQVAPCATICPLCRSALEDDVQPCRGCATRYHGGCLVDLGGCGTLGCALQGRAPETLDRWSLERVAVVAGCVALLAAALLVVPGPRPTPAPTPAPDLDSTVAAELERSPSAVVEATAEEREAALRGVEGATADLRAALGLADLVERAGLEWQEPGPDARPLVEWYRAQVAALLASPDAVALARRRVREAEAAGATRGELLVAVRRASDVPLPLEGSRGSLDVEAVVLRPLLAPTGAVLGPRQRADAERLLARLDAALLDGGDSPERVVAAWQAAQRAARARDAALVELDQLRRCDPAGIDGDGWRARLSGGDPHLEARVAAWRWEALGGAADELHATASPRPGTTADDAPGPTPTLEALDALLALGR